jgi:hypothetical protein
MAYQKCAQKAQQRSKQRREAALSRLTMPDGRWPSFNKASRKLIPAELLDQIRCVRAAACRSRAPAKELPDGARCARGWVGRPGAAASPRGLPGPCQRPVQRRQQPRPSGLQAATGDRPAPRRRRRPQVAQPRRRRAAPAGAADAGQGAQALRLQRRPAGAARLQGARHHRSCHEALPDPQAGER